jgi:hypothetical protein
MDAGPGLAECDVEIAGVIGDGHSFADGGHKNLHRTSRGVPGSAKSGGNTQLMVLVKTLYDSISSSHTHKLGPIVRRHKH